jgi:hypothetical protein
MHARITERDVIYAPVSSMTVSKILGWQKLVLFTPHLFRTDGRPTDGQECYGMSLEAAEEFVKALQLTIAAIRLQSQESPPES